MTKIVELVAREDASPSKSNLELPHLGLLWVYQES